MDSDIVSNCGINHAIVGSSSKYEPIDENQMQDNSIVAEEFVFGNKYQIIPIISLGLMRREYFVLWKDENINNEENTNYIKFLLKQEVNIYSTQNNDEAIQIIQLKKRNKMKIITNCGRDLSGKKLIEHIRNEFHYNFIILVFSSNLGHISWVKNIPNVILTTEISKFRDFIMLEMTHKNVMNYIRSLEDSYDVKFNINEEEILYFPDFIDDVWYPTQQLPYGTQNQEQSWNWFSYISGLLSKLKALLRFDQ